MQSNFFVDDRTVAELVLLRALAEAHRQVDVLNNRGFSQETNDLRAGAYREIKRILQGHTDLINEDRKSFGEALGVVVGRFQVDKLHDGHKCLIETVRKRHQCYMIAMGLTMDDKPDDKNPLSFHMRSSMILEDFPDCVIVPVRDCGSDTVWSHELDRAIRTAVPHGTVRLYGGRDSFIPCYHGQFKTTEITAIDGTSGTSIRKALGLSPGSNVEFRRGIIFATQIQKES